MSDHLITVSNIQTIVTAIKNKLTALAGTIPVIDSTLTQTGQAADAAAVGAVNTNLSTGINGLRADLGDIKDRFDDPNVIDDLKYVNGIMVASGAVSSASANAHSITFDVEPSTQYRIVMPIANRSGFAGNNTGVFEAGQTYTAFSASVTYTNSYVFTTPANVTSVILYFYNGTYKFDPDDFQLYKGNSIPSDLNVRLKESSLPLQIPFSSIRGVKVEKTQTSFIQQVPGKNIFNKNDSDIESGMMLNANGTATSLSSETYKITGYIEVLPETDYSVYAGNNSAAQYASDVYVTAQFYDSGKNRIGSAVGTMDSSGEFYTITSISGAVFMRVNLYNSLGVFMVVKGDEYPTGYSPYSSGFELVGVSASGTNPLTGKIIVWDGDSICAGKAFNDTHDAWAGRIAAENQMTYKNYGVGGGTITENVVSGGVTKHSVCANLETIYAEFPNVDYFVFDGGCNDADLLGSMITGTPERLGTFSLSDFSGNYDEDTFCGAFESILYRMTNYWRNAKFAYIIPHKMGILNQYRTNYDKEHHNYRAYYDLAIQMCIKWGVQYLDLWDKCYFCPMITHLCDTNSEMTQQEIYDAGMVYADRQHLTERGYDIESTMIENWLRTI